MIKLLIADDEEDTRIGIRSIIAWQEHGIEICGEAKNGKEALELIERTAPDIILVDIRMPIVDGLRVIESLYKSGSATKAIVLSGYDDFTYAQKAMELGASEYLLKPCRPKKILETVLKVKQLIEKEKDKADRTERIRQQFYESLPFLKEKYLTQLILGLVQDDSGISENFSVYQISLTPIAASVAVLRIDNFTGLRSQKSNADVEFMKLAVIDITKQTLNSKLNHEVIGYLDDIVVIANTAAENEIITFPLMLADVKSEVAMSLGFTLSIGVSRRCETINKVRQAYEDALNTLDFLFFTGTNSIMTYDEIREYAFSKANYPLDEEKDLLNCVVSGRAGELAEKLGNFLGVLNDNNLSKDHYIKSSLALTFTIYHACIENNVDTDDIFGRDLSALDDISKTDNISALEDRLLVIMDASARKFASFKSRNSYMEFILKYIDENFSNEISLESIASEAYITPGYVSLLFKQTIGINFVDYLQKVRIKKACELLKDIRLKVYEISTTVGFKDERYFSQVFKKNTGLTPSQYREMIIHR